MSQNKGTRKIYRDSTFSQRIFFRSNEYEIESVAGKTITTKTPHCFDTGDRVVLAFKGCDGDIFKTLATVVPGNSTQFTVPDNIPDCFEEAWAFCPIALMGTPKVNLYSYPDKNQALTGKLTCSNGSKVAIITDSSAFDFIAGMTLSVPSAFTGATIEDWHSVSDSDHYGCDGKTYTHKLVLGTAAAATLTDNEYFVIAGEDSRNESQTELEYTHTTFTGHLNYGEVEFAIPVAEINALKSSNHLLQMLLSDGLLYYEQLTFTGEDSPKNGLVYDQNTHSIELLGGNTIAPGDIVAQQIKVGAGFTIPESGSVTVPIEPVDVFGNGQSETVLVQKVAGILSLSNGTYTFTRNNSGDSVFVPQGATVFPLATLTQLQVPSYGVAELPPPTLGGVAVVTDEQKNTNLAFSTENEWLRAHDLQPVTDAPPDWVPNEAVLHIDFEENLFYWDGQARKLSDLTPHPSGIGYTLDWGGWFTGEGATISCDMTPDVNSTISGHIFSSVSASNQRIDILAYNISNNPPRKSAWAYTSATSPATFLTIPGQTYTGKGRSRYILSLKDGQEFLGVVGNTVPGSLSASLPTFEQPVRIGFANWARPNQNSPLTNCVLHSITIWPSASTIQEIDEIASKGSPVHFLGDSFLGLQALQDAFRVYANPKSGYIPISQDGVGGSSLAEQADRVAAYSGSKLKWLNSTLVIMDGGLSDEIPFALTSLARILKYFPHDRFIYLQQGSPTSGYGTTAWDQWDAKNKAISHFLGDHYIPTMAHAMRYSDGSIEDEANIGEVRWPVSTMLSAGDFHPSEKGYGMLARVIYSALSQRGWV